jgi:hypothetical protein
MAKSRWRKLSNGRKLVCDIIHLAKKVPLAGSGAALDVRELAEVRKLVRPRIAWNVLLMKAYAQVAIARPELRQLYVRWPWPHVYQHPQNVCLMTFSREYLGEDRLFFGRFNAPEEETLLDLQKRYDEYRDGPVDSVKQFRHQIRFAKAPLILRRMAWFLMRDVWVRKAASHMGTFGMSISCFREAYGTSLVSPNTTSLGVDVISKGGISNTLLTFDHRILDAQTVIGIFQELGRQLRGPILEELRAMVSTEQGESTVQEKHAA